MEQNLNWHCNRYNNKWLLILTMNDWLLSIKKKKNPCPIIITRMTRQVLKWKKSSAIHSLPCNFFVCFPHNICIHVYHVWLSMKCWLHFHKSAQTLFCVLRIFCNRENFFQYTNYQNNKNLVGKKNGFNWIFFSLYVHKCLWNNWIMTLFVFHFWKI